MLLTELSWTILVLIPKGIADTRGVGLIEVMWKVVYSIVDTRINTIVTFHDVLYGFCACRGTGTDIIEINMAQYLASID